MSAVTAAWICQELQGKFEQKSCQNVTLKCVNQEFDIDKIVFCAISRIFRDDVKFGKWLMTSLYEWRSKFLDF